MRTKGDPKIAESLAAMNKNDTWSLLLFVLYKLRDDPNWLTLSELSFLMQGDELVRFLSYFEGLTITIPKLKDLRLLLKLLTIYQMVEFNDVDLDAAINTFGKEEFSKDELKTNYVKILDVVRDYEFRGE